MDSLTEAKTNWMFLVSIAVVKWWYKGLLLEKCIRCFTLNLTQKSTININFHTGKIYISVSDRELDLHLSSKDEPINGHTECLGEA